MRAVSGVARTRSPRLLPDSLHCRPEGPGLKIGEGGGGVQGEKAQQDEPEKPHKRGQPTREEDCPWIDGGAVVDVVGSTLREEWGEPC